MLIPLDFGFTTVLIYFAINSLYILYNSVFVNEVEHIQILVCPFFIIQLRFENNESLNKLEIVTSYQVLNGVIMPQFHDDFTCLSGA